MYIDERDVKDYKLGTPRTYITLVSQEPTLFAGTIHENIAYGKKEKKKLRAVLLFDWLIRKIGRK